MVASQASDTEGEQNSGIFSNFANFFKANRTTDGSQSGNSSQQVWKEFPWEDLLIK